MQQIRDLYEAVFLSPASAFFWPVSLTFVVISLLSAVCLSDSDLKLAAVRYFKPLWLGRRTLLVDFAMGLVHVIFLQSVFAAVNEVFNWQTPPTILIFVSKSLPWLDFENMPNWLNVTLAALILALAFDFGSYCSHRFVHTTRLTWVFHQVHHSGHSLSLFTNFRRHPFDHLIRLSIAYTSLGLATVFVELLFRNQMSVMYPATITFAAIYMLTGFLQHSHVPVVYPKFARIILLSPHLHLLHHSDNPEHYSKNYGGIFSFWDRLFGTYYDVDFDMSKVRLGTEYSLEKDSLLNNYFPAAVKSLFQLPKSSPTRTNLPLT